MKVTAGEKNGCGCLLKGGMVVVWAGGERGAFKITVIPLHRKDTWERDTRISTWENATRLTLYLKKPEQRLEKKNAQAHPTISLNCHSATHRYSITYFEFPRETSILDFLLRYRLVSGAQVKKLYIYMSHSGSVFSERVCGGKWVYLPTDVPQEVRAGRMGTSILPFCWWATIIDGHGQEELMWRAPWLEMCAVNGVFYWMAEWERKWGECDTELHVEQKGKQRKASHPWEGERRGTCRFQRAQTQDFSRPGIKYRAYFTGAPIHF